MKSDDTLDLIIPKHRTHYGVQPAVCLTLVATIYKLDKKKREREIRETTIKWLFNNFPPELLNQTQSYSGTHSFNTSCDSTNNTVFACGKLSLFFVSPIEIGAKIKNWNSFHAPPTRGLGSLSMSTVATYPVFPPRVQAFTHTTRPHRRLKPTPRFKRSHCPEVPNRQYFKRRV